LALSSRACSGLAPCLQLPYVRPPPQGSPGENFPTACDPIGVPVRTSCTERFGYPPFRDEMGRSEPARHLHLWFCSMGDPATDEELVERMSRGDRVALGSLYERHAARLRGLALVILRDAGEADDVLHDVFIEAWRRSADYSAHRGTVSAWLALRARSRAIDRVRARKIRAESDAATEPGPSGDPIADSVRTLDRARLHGLLATMSEAEQEVLVLGYFEGLSSSEIAERIRVPIGTVKSRVRSALAKLRRAFEDERGGS
jgi:RNA polymerase sigma-70 factor (ECF subfamily)